MKQKQCSFGVHSNAGHLFPSPAPRGQWPFSWQTSSTPWPEDACLRCGTLYRDTREQQDRRRVREGLAEANGLSS